jgi:hypothetical protein
MHSAIIVVKLPADNQRWSLFLATVQGTEAPRAEKWHRLAENVWLVNFQENPEVLARLIDAAARHQLPCGILPLDDAPRWLPVSLDPMTIQDRSGV